MDLNSQINRSDYFQMEDQLTMEEIDRILDFPISDTCGRDLNQSQEIGISWASDTAAGDLYSFIDSFMGSGSSASTEQYGNQKHPIHGP